MLRFPRLLDDVRNYAGTGPDMIFEGFNTSGVKQVLRYGQFGCARLGHDLFARGKTIRCPGKSTCPLNVELSTPPNISRKLVLTSLNLIVYPVGIPPFV